MHDDAKISHRTWFIESVNVPIMPGQNVGSSILGVMRLRVVDSAREQFH
jgi:hypothetical protein